MSRFDVLSGEVVIGRTDLEMGDPVRGIASGLLEPTPEYVSVQPSILANDGQPTEDLKLSVRLSGNDGETIDGIVTISDYSSDIGGNVSAAEVVVTGISKAIYKRLFPAHVAIYERQYHG